MIMRPKDYMTEKELQDFRDHQKAKANGDEPTNDQIFAYKLYHRIKKRIVRNGGNFRVKKTCPAMAQLSDIDKVFLRGYRRARKQGKQPSEMQVEAYRKYNRLLHRLTYKPNPKPLGPVYSLMTPQQVQDCRDYDKAKREGVEPTQQQVESKRLYARLRGNQYYHSGKGKEYIKRYISTPKGKEVVRKAGRKYRAKKRAAEKASK